MQVLDEAAQRYGEFLGLPATCTIAYVY